MSHSQHPPSTRTKIRRSPKQAHYDTASLYAIVDEAYMCNIAFHSEGTTHCIPMACWRQGDFLYIHGSTGSRLMKNLSSGMQVSLSMTHLDGLVLARSAFNHSMNYRSAVIYGQFEIVAEESEKRLALDAFMDKLVPGRNAEIRRGSKKEFNSTIVLRISLAEAAAKIRSGDPIDDEEDMGLEVWAGVLPMRLTRQSPITDKHTSVSIPVYLRDWCNNQ